MVSLGITKTYRKFFPLRLAQWKQLKPLFEYKRGIEIGGPTPAFGINGVFPVYNVSESVDCANFSTETIWEGSLKDEGAFSFEGREMGVQYVAEATTLSKIQDRQYDFVLSSHCLEHVANPLKALLEWKRILKKDGTIILILPNPAFTFDRKREITSFDHLLADFNADVQEDDITHVEEFIEMCDFELCKSGYRDFEHFKSICRDNALYRCIHQHVFSVGLVEEMAAFSQLSIQTLFKFRDVNMYFVLRKID